MTQLPNTWRRAALLLACPATLGLAVALGGSAGTTIRGRGLGPYLVQGAEESGFRITGKPSTADTAASLDLGDPAAAADNRRLRTERFRRALTVHTGSLTGEGVSRAIALGSPTAAASELRAQTIAARKVMGPRQTRPFTAPGIPGIVGLASAAGDAHAVNVLFREGQCVLIVGDETSQGSSRAAAVHAARAIYARTHGRGGPCAS